MNTFRTALLSVVMLSVSMSAQQAAPAAWEATAHKADLNADGTPDLLVEEVVVWFPGQPTTFRVKPLSPAAGTSFVLKTALNGKTADVPFVAAGSHYEARFTGDAPRWIHYSACAGGAADAPRCSEDLVTASPTTSLDYALKRKLFVPAGFAVPEPPRIGSYVWNILEPAILTPDYQALLDRAAGGPPPSITLVEDHGELKRHAWEFENRTAFAYGILTADKSSELGCVYINPSPKAGYDASVRLWVTKQGADAGLEPVLEKAVRAWIKEQWPFVRAAFPGRDMPMAEWNALPAMPPVTATN